MNVDRDVAFTPRRVASVVANDVVVGGVVQNVSAVVAVTHRHVRRPKSGVIANASTPLGATITNFVAGDIPAATTFSRFTVLLSRASGAGDGVVRLDDAVLEVVAPGCGDRIVETGLGEVCDTAERASDTTVGACRLDCSGFVPEPVVDAAVGEDASTSVDAGPDAGTIERRESEYAASPGSDAAPSWSVLFLLGVAVCACFRRARHAG